jgi:hypothetical protein
VAIVQIQRVRRYRDGKEIVTYAQDFDVSSPREQEDALRSVEHDMLDGEFSRTLGEGSLLWVRVSADLTEAWP